jgi:hypothetical protein
MVQLTPEQRTFVIKTFYETSIPSRLAVLLHGRMGLILGGGSTVCPNRQTEHKYFSPKLLASGGWGEGGDHKKIFPDISTNVLQNFADITKKSSGHTKYFSTNIRKFCRTYQKIFPNITNLVPRAFPFL